MDPFGVFSSILAHGPGRVSLIDKEILSASRSLIITFTFTFCPSDKTSEHSLNARKKFVKYAQAHQLHQYQQMHQKMLMR